MKIEITRTLLEKPVDFLTKDEKAAVEEFKESRRILDERLKNANEAIVKNCKVLCSRHHMPIPACGWIYPVESLCYNIEAINVEMDKYGIQVVLDQSKDKYGTLRFYTTTEIKEIGFFGRLIRFVDLINDKLSDVDYGIVYVTDNKEYKSVEWKEITKEQFDNRTNQFNCPFSASKEIVVLQSKSDIKNLIEHEDTTFLVEESGRFFYSYFLYHTEKKHPEITKHRILHKILNASLGLSTWLKRFYKTSREQHVMFKMVDKMVDDMIENTELKCHKLCQHCGLQFGDNEIEYERCETQGWYMYVCEDCAKASGMTYRKGKKFYREGVEQTDTIESETPNE